MVRDAIIAQGHVLTYDWTTHGPVYSKGLDVVRMVAVADAQGIFDADAVIALWPGGRGTHVEIGIAIGLSLPIFFVSGVENHHRATQETCAFYHHPCVQRCSNLEQLYDHLARFAGEE